MSNIIFGVYNGYTSLQTANGGIYYFMKSLRKYNKDCKVVIICEKQKIFNDLITFSKEMDFEIYSDFVLRYEMMYYRFEIYRNYLLKLQAHQHETIEHTLINKVLMSDINDVIFQDDPFSINFSEDMYCALEQNVLSDNTNSSSTLNMRWINENHHLIDMRNNTYLNKYLNQYVVCAGTILCTFAGAMTYLEFYNKSMQRAIVNDQGLLNVYVYNFLVSKQILEYKKSKILTLDKIDFNTLNIAPDGSIINDLGEKYIIIHQINRCNLPFMLQLVK